MPKIITYNVNGIRAAIKKGLVDWLKSSAPDIVCIQETKAQLLQIPVELFEELDYHVYTHSAVKKGYSGVAILTKIKPDNVVEGIGIEKYDVEGRMLRADFGDISVFSVYHPSGTTGDVRQEFKYEWLDDFHAFVNELRKERPKLVISGDYNICHKPIDIHDPVGNKNSSGFLPDERAWFDRFVESGMIDSFRYFNQEPHHYSWWSYRANARANNKGWRIDYNMVTENLENNLKRSVILPEAKHSDHCPVLLEMDF